MISVVNTQGFSGVHPILVIEIYLITTNFQSHIKTVQVIFLVTLKTGKISLPLEQRIPTLNKIPDLVSEVLLIFVQNNFFLIITAMKL